MPVFPSQEWCEALVARLNADPDSALAAAGWEGDFGGVIDAEPGRLERPFTVHVVPHDGKLTRLTVLSDPDDLDELEPAYLVRAPYSVWKSLLQGTLDPVEAVIKRRVSIRGDMEPILQRARFKGIGDRVLEGLGTTFIDDR